MRFRLDRKGKNFRFNLAVVVTIQQVCVCEKFFHIIKHKRVKRGLRFRRVVSTWELSVFFLFFFDLFYLRKKIFLFCFEKLRWSKISIIIVMNFDQIFFLDNKKKIHSILWMKIQCWPCNLIHTYNPTTQEKKRKKRMLGEPTLPPSSENCLNETLVVVVAIPTTVIQTLNWSLTIFDQSRTPIFSSKKK
mgnify:CR=1 FL=1